MPSAIAALIMGDRIHCFTYFFWIAWKVLNSSEGHAGYEFPWSPMRVFPFVSGASFHDHHHSTNIGNYGSACYLWDMTMGTGDLYFDQFIK